MRLNLNNPASIVSWYRQHPKRHGPQIAAFLRMWPQFEASISKARQMIVGAR